MNPSILRKDILSKGAILGGIMLAAQIADTLMRYYGGLYLILFIALLAIVSMVIYCVFLYRFTKNYSKLVLSLRQEAPYFTYGNGLSYAVLISMLAGVVIAIGHYILVHGIIGYENYIDTYSEFLKNAIAQLEVLDARSDTDFSSLIDLNKQELGKIESATEAPTLINTIVINTWGYLVTGTIVGSFVAIFTRRKLQPIKNNDEQEKQNEQ